MKKNFTKKIIDLEQNATIGILEEDGTVKTKLLEESTLF